MNANEWAISNDPARMLDYLLAMRGVSKVGHSAYPPPDVSDRKLRLLGCAFCRAASPPLDGADLNAVGVAERFADGAATFDELDRATWNQAEGSVRGMRTWVYVLHFIKADESAGAVLHNLSVGGVSASALAPILRDLIGDPFRPVTLPRVEIECPDCDPADLDENCDDCGGSGLIDGGCPWLTADVLGLAQAAYEERLPDGTLDPARLAVLSDALEEVGCDSDDLLRHLRSQEEKLHFGAGDPSAREWMPLRGPHFRGCWAVDLLLGKS